MKRILVPVDFSPAADKAFHYAADIALKTKGIVIPYHVYKHVATTFIDALQKICRNFIFPSHPIVSLHSYTDYFFILKIRQ